MAQTVPFGFEVEALNEEPGRTLNGGSDGLSPRLGDQVNDALVDIAADIADLTSRMTAAETALAAVRWRHIAEGQNSGANFSIPVPAGFELLQLRLWGGLDASGRVQLRINADATAGLHLQGWVTQDSQTTPIDDEADLAADTSWFLADWGSAQGNTVDVTVFDTLAGARPSYQAYAGRMSTDPSIHRRTHAHGSLEADRVVSSLQIVCNQPISLMKWWLDGRLAP